MVTELWEKVTPEDLQVSLSSGFICRCSLKSFLELREMLSKYFSGKNGEFLVYSKVSSNELVIVTNNKNSLKVTSKWKEKTKRKK
jgi:hypothetical protein